MRCRLAGSPSRGLFGFDTAGVGKFETFGIGFPRSGVGGDGLCSVAEKSSMMRRRVTERLVLIDGEKREISEGFEVRIKSTSRIVPVPYE